MVYFDVQMGCCDFIAEIYGFAFFSIYFYFSSSRRFRYVSYGFLEILGAEINVSGVERMTVKSENVRISVFL